MNLSQFEQFDLSPELLKALEKKGYSRPTAIQMEAIPAAMEERDVLGSAPTGTGKTAAFYYLRYNIYWIIRVVNQAHRVFWY